MEELEKLIKIIDSQHSIISDSWQTAEEYYPINMKKIRVEDVYKNEKYLIYVFNYRKYISDNITELVETIQNIVFQNTINTRIKALNSIQYKIQNYKQNHENGKIALKKCLNDVFGIRIILNDNIDYKKIKKYINKEFPKLKCIESKRNEYQAVHVYFGNDDNYKFQWELQIWNKKDEIKNLESHKKYKQDYVKWEQKNI